MTDKIVSVRMPLEMYEQVKERSGVVGVSGLIRRYIEFGLHTPFVRGTSFDGGATWFPDFPDRSSLGE